MTSDSFTEPKGSSSTVSGTPVAVDARQARLIRSTLAPATEPDSNGQRNGQHDIADSLVSLPELARQMVGAEFGAITVLDSDGRVIDMVYAGLTPEEASKIGAPPRGVGVLGRLGDSNQPLLLDKISDDPNSVGFPPHHPPMDALLGVCVSTDGPATANLYVGNGPGKGTFSESDREKITALAAYARIALDNAQLYEEERGLRSSAEAAEQRLSAVIRGSAAGVVVKDAATGRFLHVSGEAHSITGTDFTESEAGDGHPFEHLYHHVDGTPMVREEIPMNVALNKGESSGPIEVLFIRPDGSRLPVVASAAPVFDSYGELDSAVCVFVDVTKLKELEQAKDDFLSMVTHDLRTPLTTIKGMAAAALGAATRSDTESAVSFLEPIDDEVDYLTELVSNLLDMTRIEAGGDVFEFEVCHLADIAQDSFARMSRTRDARRRDIHTNVAPDLPAIFADPGQIGRVIDNLVSNALKYSDNGIGITARILPGEGKIRVEVDDRGPGIPPEHQTAIFDRFARLKGSETAGRQGSGLGLAICKSIITAHSGEIGVNSSRNGSVFWFTLPMDVGAD